MAYAKTMNPDKIYILSAKYGLLALDDEIEPYNVTLNTMKIVEKKAWAEKILLQLEKAEFIESTKFVFLAGNNYRKYLMPDLSHTEVPMEGLPIGKQLQFLTEKLR